MATLTFVGEPPAGETEGDGIDGARTITLTPEGEAAPAAPGPASPAPATPAPAAEPAPDSWEAHVAALESQIAEGKAQIEQERNARTRAEAAAREAESRARTNADQANVSRAREARASLDSVTNALAAAESDLEKLVAEAAKAAEAGDFVTQSKLQGQMAIKGAEITRYRGAKGQLETQQPPPDAAVRTQPVVADWNRPWSPQEAEAYLAERSPDTAAWIRANPRFITDVAFRHKVWGADTIVTADGIARDTPAYFDRVEQMVGLRQQAPAAEPVSAAGETVSRTSPGATPAAAPPARPAPAAAARPTARPVASAAPATAVPTARPGQSGEIVLTAEERRLARQIMTPEVIGKNPDGTPKDPELEYARQKARQIADGIVFRGR